MRTRKRLVAETETHRVITVSVQSINGLCAGCSLPVSIIPLESAAKTLEISVAELHRRLAAAEGPGTPTGTCLWVCRARLPPPEEPAKG